MSTDRTSPELEAEGRRLVARVALNASESMPIATRIMLNHGLASLFPDGSRERRHALETAAALSAAERRQLQLAELLR